MQLFPSDTIGALGHELRTRAMSNNLEIRVGGKTVASSACTITDFVKDGVHTTVVDFIDEKAIGKAQTDIEVAKAEERAAALEGRPPSANGGVRPPEPKKAKAEPKKAKAEPKKAKAEPKKAKTEIKKGAKSTEDVAREVA